MTDSLSLPVGLCAVILEMIDHETLTQMSNHPFVNSHNSMVCGHSSRGYGVCLLLPATSAPVECIFSQSGIILRPHCIPVLPDD